jgi:triosephosphate isomerase
MSGVRYGLRWRPLVAANWKMHLLRADAEALCRRLREGLPAGDGVEVVVFPSATLLAAAQATLAGSPIALGGQDVHPEDAGAYTGDLAASQLRDAGCVWALCGHSERRRYHGEDDRTIGRKMAAAARHGLRPLLCVGETAEERKRGATFEVLARQLRDALAEAPAAFDVAYEPVWAIGTGATATPEIAQEAHAFLRRELEALGGADQAAGTRLLYGGSVKADNAGALIAQDAIDGFLVGGASLDSAQFLTIIAASAMSPRDGG